MINYMKKILLTGATGMIGAAICRAAILQDFQVCCIVHKNTKRICNLPKSKKLSIVYADLSELATLELKEKFDCFIHLAWDKTFVDGRDDVDTQLQNILYTLDAVRLAKRSGCSVFIGAGSQAEYGVQSVPLTSSLPCNPESGYGIAKYSAGKLSFILCNQLGLRFNWIRILSIYGQFDGANTLVSYVIDELKNGKSPVLTKCEQVWDYLNCDDAANAFLAVAEKGVSGKTYPLGSGNPRELCEYVKDIRDIIAPNIELGFGKKEYYPHQPMYLVADICELKKDTGWVPNIEFKDGIRGTFFC